MKKHRSISELIKAFDIADYTVRGSSGLSLVIPFPHHSLTRDGIIAAAIEHFAPAIISGSLIVKVDSETVDQESIEAQVLRVAESLPAGPLREDPKRFLSLIRHTNINTDFLVTVQKPSAKLAEALGEMEHEKLRKMFETAERLSMTIKVPLTRNGKSSVSDLLAVVARTPKGRKPTDLFFREGMCLPEVSARNPADVDLVIQSNEGELVSYLNFCEGKAHLGLIENKEVTDKLAENGFLDGYAVKRLVRRLMDELRGLVLPDTSKPDNSIFSGFFSVSRKNSSYAKSESGTGNKETKKPPPPPPVPPLPPRPPSIFFVDELEDGFRVRANPAYTSWPVNLSVEVAYADGSRKPKWSRYDFELSKLGLVQRGKGAKVVLKQNVITCSGCGTDFGLEVRGFDSRRELVTNVRGIRYA